MKFTFDRPTAGRRDTIPQIVELARHADAAGFDRYAVSDWKFYQDCFVVMTACLMATRKLEAESTSGGPA